MQNHISCITLATATSAATVAACLTDAAAADVAIADVVDDAMSATLSNNLEL